MPTWVTSGEDGRGKGWNRKKNIYMHMYGKRGRRVAREGGMPTGHAVLQATREGARRRLTLPWIESF
eukprot:11332184-Heterocapsa_arctica.AAC.1